MRIKLWLEHKYPKDCSRLRELFTDEKLEDYLKTKDGNFGLSFCTEFLQRRQKE